MTIDTLIAALKPVTDLVLLDCTARRMRADFYYDYSYFEMLVPTDALGVRFQYARQMLGFGWEFDTSEVVC